MVVECITGAFRGITFSCDVPKDHASPDSTQPLPDPYPWDLLWFFVVPILTEFFCQPGTA